MYWQADNMYNRVRGVNFGGTISPTLSAVTPIISAPNKIFRAPHIFNL